MAGAQEEAVVAKKTTKASPKKSSGKTGGVSKNAAKAAAGKDCAAVAKNRLRDLEHEKEMARFRYQLGRSKKSVRKAHKKAKGPEKKRWLAMWQKTSNFDFVEAEKLESKGISNRKRRKSLWLTKDKIYDNEGWTLTNSETPQGQRAAMRAENIVSFCDKMGKKYKKRPTARRSFVPENLF